MQVILCYRRRRSAGRAVHEGQTETHAQYVNIGKSELHFWGAAGKTDKLTKHIAAKKTHVQITGMQIACNLQKIGFMIMPSLKECFFVASICMFGITAQKKTHTSDHDGGWHQPQLLLLHQLCWSTAAWPAAAVAAAAAEETLAQSVQFLARLSCCCYWSPP